MLRVTITLATALIFGGTASAVWQPVGDVDGEDTGFLVNGTAGWTDNGWWGFNSEGVDFERTQIAAKPGGDDNALLVDSEGGGSIRLFNAIPAISTSSTAATLYFQLYIPATEGEGEANDSHDSAIGLSSSAAPSGWIDGPGLSIKDGQIGVGNQAFDQALADDTWHDIWIQMNPSAGFWWALTKDSETGEAIRLTTGGGTDSWFASPKDYQSLYVPTGGGTDKNGSYYFDEVFVDSEAFSITDPNAIVVIPGDANGDGQVTGADLSILDANFGMAGGVSEGDFNGDGQVTGADLSILDANFGAGVGEASSAVSAVPEPTSIALIGLGGLALLRRRTA